MIDHYTRMAGLVLAFGFFFGCSSSRQASDNSGARAADYLSENRFEQRMKAIDKQLKSDQFSPSLYYQKGALLIEWAQEKEHPGRRTPLYREAGLMFQKAGSLLESRPESAIDTLQYNRVRRGAWSGEHNRGIQISETASSEKDHRQAGVHFSNASAIMPGNTASYKLASRAYYKGESPGKAIGLLERARLNIAPMPVDLLESLAFLYVETDQPSKAIILYKEARSRHRNNFNLMHGLSNAYIKAEKHQQAIRLLQQLADKKPGNIRYRYSLASEYYKAGREAIIAMTAELEDNGDFNAAAFSAADLLFNRAEDQYNAILDKQPGNVQLVYSAVQFYQNTAAQYQRLLPYLDRNEKANIKNYIKKNVTASVPLLEQLTEKKPSEQMWEYLYRTYSFLGMQAEAEKTKANF